MKRLLVGGEHYNSPLIYLQSKKFNLKNYLKKNHSNMYSYETLGGYSSIITISKEIRKSNQNVILLPSYLCSSINEAFNDGGIKHKYYHVDENFKIDVEDVLSKIENDVCGMLFINYFGVVNNEDEINFLKKRVDKRFFFIEDMVHNLFVSKCLGDYCFNSYRKYFPLEGSTILSKEKIKSSTEGNNDIYLKNKIKGRYLRYFYSKFNIYRTNFLSFFSEAEKHYKSKIVYSFSKHDSFLLSRINLEKEKNIRIENYKYFHNVFKEYRVFNEIDLTSFPIGFPIFVEDRDQIRQRLIEENIFCPIHWSLPIDVDERVFFENVRISKKILTIPINFSLEHQERIKKSIFNVILS